MNKKVIYSLLLLCAQLLMAHKDVPSDTTLDEDIAVIKKNIYSHYVGMLKPATGVLKYPYITPGSSQYESDLWDWDSWLSDVALRQIFESKKGLKKKDIIDYERGCILNFLEYGAADGYLPIVIWHGANPREQMPENIYRANMHKPVIAQHAAFLIKEDGGNAEWLREKFYYIQAFVSNYKHFHRDPETGLYFWQNDIAIGVDNDPSTYYRPNRSSGSIFLNSLMYKELLAVAYIAEQLNLPNIVQEFRTDAATLKQSIQQYCWDERDGTFYSVDLNLLPISEKSVKTLGIELVIHSGNPRSWHSLIQRIDCWASFMPLWAGIATPAQAARMVKEHYLNTKTYHAPYGVRTLSKLEKMYSVRASSNPSNWLGPIWGIANYLVYRGLLTYGYTDEADDLAQKTIRMFAMDFRHHGALHENYDPDTGEPILNKGFQNWNYLVMNMIASIENEKVISEF